MSEEQLRLIVARLRRQASDDGEVEVKAAGGTRLPSSLWDSVSAFANTDGGLIIFGLEEGAGFAPATGFRPQQIIDALVAGLSQAPNVAPKVMPVPVYDLDRGEVDGSPVVALRIHSLRGRTDITLPCFVTAKGVIGGSYKRVDDQDVRLSAYEVQLFRQQHVPQVVDREPVTAASTDDLDDVVIGEVLAGLRRAGSRALTGVSDEDRRAALRRINAVTADGLPTLAGYLTLATYPQQEFPSLVIDVAVHPGTVKSTDSTVRFLDRKRCDGPLAEAISAAVTAVARNLSRKRIIEGAGGRDELEIPEDVLREAVTNAAVHRDFSAVVREQQVAVDVFPDRVEVSNPGGFWGDRTKENIGDGHSAQRNPNLVRLLGLVPLPGGGYVVENQGSGVPRMIAAMREHGLPAPDYSASTLSRVVVKLDRFGLLGPDVVEWLEALPFDLDRESQVAMAIARRNGTVTVGDLRAQLGLDSDDARRVIARLVSEEALFGINDGPYRLNLPDVPGTGVRSDTEWEILSVLAPDEPRSIRDIARVTGKTANALRPVLRKLVGDGAVLATAPPTSRSRKYVLPR